VVLRRSETFPLAPVRVRKVVSVRVGERTYAIGSPQGLESTLSNGLVSGLLPVGKMKIVQTTAPISRGSSGGGLFDVRGALMGITTVYLKDGQNLNFAVPADQIAVLQRTPAAAVAGATYTLQQDGATAAAQMDRRPDLPTPLSSVHAVLLHTMSDGPIATQGGLTSKWLHDQVSARSAYRVRSPRWVARNPGAHRSPASLPARRRSPRGPRRPRRPRRSRSARLSVPCSVAGLLPHADSIPRSPATSSVSHAPARSARTSIRLSGVWSPLHPQFLRTFQSTVESGTHDKRITMLTMSRWLLVVGAITVVGCAVHQPRPNTSAGVDESAGDPWNRFWTARGVSPPPPRDFMEAVNEAPPEILNLTGGAVDEETVRRWVVGNLRRGRGDSWAARHMRLDIVNADVLGPPGLNGTDRGIRAEQVRGTVEILTPHPTSEVEKIAVVAIPGEVQRLLIELGMTDFVVVRMSRTTGHTAERLLGDGRREPIPVRRPAGDLSWQVDTGGFREHPVIGPLWYQAHGWSCLPDSEDLLAELCGLVRPTSGNATDSSAESP
jgi:hypothetical protein